MRSRKLVKKDNLIKNFATRRKILGMVAASGFIYPAVLLGQNAINRENLLGGDKFEYLRKMVCVVRNTMVATFKYKLFCSSIPNISSHLRMYPGESVQSLIGNRIDWLISMSDSLPLKNSKAD